MPADRLRSVKRALFILALLPLLRLVFLGFTDDLGANPVEFVIRSNGTWTLTFLLLTLNITPLRQLTGMNWLLALPAGLSHRRDALLVAGKEGPHPACTVPC